MTRGHESVPDRWDNEQLRLSGSPLASPGRRFAGFDTGKGLTVDSPTKSVGVARLFLALSLAFFALGVVYIVAAFVRVASPHYVGWFSLGNAYWYEFALGGFFVLFGGFWLCRYRRYP